MKFVVCSSHPVLKNNRHMSKNTVMRDFPLNYPGSQTPHGRELENEPRSLEEPLYTFSLSLSYGTGIKLGVHIYISWKRRRRAKTLTFLVNS